jgi:hypothetical protein
MTTFGPHPAGDGAEAVLGGKTPPRRVDEDDDAAPIEHRDRRWQSVEARRQ